MATLYRLRSGRISRDEYDPEEFRSEGRNATVFRARYKAPYEFVPSPGELSANQFRMVPVGAVEDNSLHAANASLNTNSDALGTARRSSAVAHTTSGDIRSMSAHDAALTVRLAETETDLDRFLDVELNNKPRTRKMVIKAIEERRVELASGVSEGD